MDSHLEAWINADGGHIVCGRRLHALCLYDVLLLELQENPLWLRHTDITWGDLLTAVLVCSTAPDEWLNPRNGSSLFKRIRRFLWLAWVRRGRALEIECRKFAVYLADYHSHPEFWVEEGGEGAAPIKAPWILSLAAFLEDHSNMTEREILTAPIGKMLWKSACLAEQLGMSRGEMVSDAELTAIEVMKAMPGP